MRCKKTDNIKQLKLSSKTLLELKRNGIEKIEDLSKKSLTLVTITSEKTKEIKKDLKVHTILEDGNTIKFSNNLTYDELIKKISKYKIDRILIEEATIEDIFLHFYK